MDELQDLGSLPVDGLSRSFRALRAWCYTFLLVEWAVLTSYLPCSVLCRCCPTAVRHCQGYLHKNVFVCESRDCCFFSSCAIARVREAGSSSLRLVWLLSTLLTFVIKFMRILAFCLCECVCFFSFYFFIYSHNLITGFQPLICFSLKVPVVMHADYTITVLV